MKEGRFTSVNLLWGKFESLRGNFRSRFFSLTTNKDAAECWEPGRSHTDDLLDADTLVNPTEGLEDEETGVLNEILKTSDQKEVVHQNLREKPRAYY